MQDFWAYQLKNLALKKPKSTPKLHYYVLFGFLSRHYIVMDIQGDYAFLRQTDQENSGTFQVAMALLPPETDIGTKLRGFMGMFEVVE